MIRVNGIPASELLKREIDIATRAADDGTRTWFTGERSFELPKELGTPKYWKDKGYRVILINPKSMTGKTIFHFDQKVLLETPDKDLLLKPRKGYERYYNWYLIRSY